MGLCFTQLSIFQVTPVTLTLNVFAMSQTVLPAPAPRVRLAILATSIASSVDICGPDNARGVALFFNLRDLPDTYARTPPSECIPFIGFGRGVKWNPFS